MTWNELLERANAERQPLVGLEQLAARSPEDVVVATRLARACVRDCRLVEALSAYDRAEMLGCVEARFERALVGERIGDYPEPNDELFA